MNAGEADDAREIGERLRMIRKRRGLGLKIAADFAGISIVTRVGSRWLGGIWARC